MAEFNKLSNLVNENITIESVGDFKWKMWDPTNNKMLVSDNWQKDYQKRYQVTTDKGILDMSQSQVANMLEGVCFYGKSDINGATFSVKSNGQSGKEIRYFLNAVKVAEQTKDVNNDSDWYND